MPESSACFRWHGNSNTTTASVPRMALSCEQPALHRQSLVRVDPWCFAELHYYAAASRNVPEGSIVMVVSCLI